MYLTVLIVFVQDTVTTNYQRFLFSPYDSIYRHPDIHVFLILIALHSFLCLCCITYAVNPCTDNVVVLLLSRVIN